MNTPRVNQTDIEVRIRTMRTLWLALCFSIPLNFMVTLFVKRPEDVQPNNMLSLALLVVTMSTALVSFVVKSKIVSRAAEQQNAMMVQQGYVMAWAITEVGSLLGLLDFFVTGNRYYYILFIISLCGQLLHFPRR